MSLNEIATLFERDKSFISRHLKSIFNSGELQKEVVVAKNATTTQHGAIVGKTQTKQVEYYNLDVILSVGYRVNSKRGTQFRQWATQRLKEYLVQGYTINQKRLDELQQTVQLIQKSISSDTNLTEAKGLLDIISQYTQSFVLLNRFDSNAMETGGERKFLMKLIIISKKCNYRIKKATYNKERSNRIIRERKRQQF